MFNPRFSLVPIRVITEVNIMAVVANYVMDALKMCGKGMPFPYSLRATL